MQKGTIILMFLSIALLFLHQVELFDKDKAIEAYNPNNFYGAPLQDY